ncbi:hypothetical protein BN1723_019971, partial [Verticillium longisporum]
PQRAGC